MHRKCTVLLLVASLGLGVRVLAAPNPQPTDEARLEVLRLGEITGERLLRETVQKLSREAKREQLRRLIQAGVALAKEKDSPLSYNAAYILLQLCDDVYDADSAEVLYRFLMDKARLLKSENRQAELRLTMFSVLVRTRRFAQAERIAKEFLETPTKDRDIANRKLVVLLQLITVYANLNRLDEARKILDNLKQLPGLDSHPLILEREAWLLRFNRSVQKGRGNLPESAERA
jgi:tetratricopeptide (TPR) repeat protein